MRLVILESPYSDQNGHPVAKNVAYAKAAIIDCLERNEAPIASHLLFTQEGLLDDKEYWERVIGMQSGHAWYRAAEACVVYEDLGMSSGMAEGIREAKSQGVPVEYRNIKFTWKEPTEHPCSNELGGRTCDRCFGPIGDTNALEQEPVRDPAPAEELRRQGADPEARQTDPGDEDEALPGVNKEAEQRARVLTEQYPLSVLFQALGFGKARIYNFHHDDLPPLCSISASDRARCTCKSCQELRDCTHDG